MEYFGVDVSKDNLQVSDGRGERKRAFPNTQQGVAVLLDWLESALGLEQSHLIMELATPAIIPCCRLWPAPGPPAP